MSERIDHAAKAQGLLNLLPASFHEDEVIALAQVHATFALVEQQRIANVIKLMSMPAEDYDRLMQNTSVTAIREGLGLS